MSLRLNLDILLQTHFQLHLWRRSLFHLHLHWGSCHVSRYPSQNPWCFDSFFFYISHAICQHACEQSLSVNIQERSRNPTFLTPSTAAILVPAIIVPCLGHWLLQPSHWCPSLPHCPAKSILCRQRDPIKSSGTSLASRFCSESFMWPRVEVKSPYHYKSLQINGYQSMHAHPVTSRISFSTVLPCSLYSPLQPPWPPRGSGNMPIIDPS